MCAYPAVADHRPLPRTKLEDVSAKQLLTADKIHFQRVVLFLKGVVVHTLQRNKQSSLRQGRWVGWLVDGLEKLIVASGRDAFEECATRRGIQ